MRRLLLVPALAAVALTSVPAANAYFYDGCQSGDFVVADVKAANVQVAKVCTDQNPLTPIFQSIRCTPLTCRS